MQHITGMQISMDNRMEGREPHPQCSSVWWMRQQVQWKGVGYRIMQSKLYLYYYFCFKSLILLHKPRGIKSRTDGNKWLIFRVSCRAETDIWYPKVFPVHIWSWYHAILQQLLVETVDVFGTLPLRITLLCSLGTGRHAGGFILISI